MRHSHRITHSGPAPETARKGDPPVFSGEGHFRAPCGAGSLAVGKRSGCVSDSKDSPIRGWDMPYQYVREPLTADESDRLSNACETPTERLVVWTLLDTGLRVSELWGLTSKNVLWQQRQLRIKGKGGPYGKKTKIRVVPMSNRVRTSWSTTSPWRRRSRSRRGVPRTSSRRWPTARGSPRT